MLRARFDRSKTKNTRAPRTEMDEAHEGVIRALTRVINGLNNDPHNVSFRNRTRDILTTHREALIAAYQFQDSSSQIMSPAYYDAISSAENALRERQIRCHRVWTAFKVLIGLAAVGLAAGLFASLVFFTPVAVPAGATAAYAAAAFLINLKFAITLCGGAIPFFWMLPFYAHYDE